MKKLLVLTPLLVLAASVASAQNPIKLAWNECRDAPAAATHKTFDCLTNPGATAPVGIILSLFVAPSTLSRYVAASTVIYVRTYDDLPCWWKMRAGECRSGNWVTDVPSNRGFPTAGSPCLDANADDPDAFVATDWHSGPYAGPPAAGANEAVVIGDNVRTFEGVVQGQGHYYSGVHVLRGAKSTGTGSCAGCGTAMCIELSEVQVYQTAGSPGGDLIILRSNASASDQARITWQGGWGCVSGPRVLGSAESCTITPTRNATWGSIKTLYR